MAVRTGAVNGTASVVEVITSVSVSPAGPTFAVGVLPSIIFFSALVEILNHVGAFTPTPPHRLVFVLLPFLPPPRTPSAPRPPSAHRPARPRRHPAHVWCVV